MAYDPFSAYPGYGAPAADPYAGSYGAPAGYPAAGYGGGPSYPGADEPLRTLFLTGFPADVKERELNNLLRFLPGYEASQMNWKNGQAQGFAMFANGALARAGCDAVSQLVFDEGCVLRCEMARKNMYIREDASVKRARVSGVSAVGPPGGGYGGGAPRPAAAAYRPMGYAPVTNTGDNPPCNTLFIGNLGDATDENELRNVFASQPGFQQLKIVHGPKAVSCFLEFADVTSAMAAHQSQQGVVLGSSDRGGLRIQYSKNPFGRKRDFADANPARGGGESGYGQAAGYGGAGSGGGAATAAVKAGYTPAEYQPSGAEATDPAAPGV